MTLIRKIPKNKPACSFVTGCCKEPFSVENIDSKQIRLFLFFRLDDELDEVSLTNVEDIFNEEDWKLIGVLPTKKAAEYGNQHQFFELTDNQIEQLENDILHYANEKLLNYLATRERSLSECKEYLKRLPLNANFADTLISKSVDYNYINDSRFTELLVESQISRNKSRLEAKHALIKKGVSSDIIEIVLDRHYTQETTNNIIDYHLKKAFRKYSDTSSYKDYHKCIAYLVKKGFKYDDFADKVKAHYRRE